MSPDTRYDELLNQYHRGALADAEASARALLAEWPAHAGTLQLLGVLEARHGHFDAALALLDRAVAAAPEVASGHHNRANVLLALEQHDAAVAAYDRAFEFGTVSAPAHNNRGIALQALFRFDAALAAFESAIELDPHFADALLNRGELLIELGRRSEGAAALQRARAAGADHAKVGFVLASMGIEPAVPVAPPEFVRDLFDQYAHGFDAHLTGHLDYRAPEQVAAAAAALALGPVPVVDLGCGTGLCGPLLRPLANRLDGVDLSAAMLERAHRREVYDELACAELTGWLAERTQRYRLAVAADVLIYFGALEAVFGAVHAALQPGGCFVFTVEALEAVDAAQGHTGEDFALQPTRRYAHKRAYLERLAATHGFTVLRLDSEVLRSESRVDVPGWLVALQR